MCVGWEMTNLVLIICFEIVEWIIIVLLLLSASFFFFFTGIVFAPLIFSQQCSNPDAA